MTIRTERTLYKQTSTGATQIWYLEIDGDKFRSVSGQIDGKKTVSAWKVAKPKNVGKANETSGSQQAILEVEALYRKKLSVDYHETVDTIETRVIFEPMLANKYKDLLAKGKIDFKQRMFVQPKLDGFRCIARVELDNKRPVVKLFSRKGKPIVNAPHVAESLLPLFKKFGYDMILDGELYNHDFADDFNSLSSMFKKQNPTTESLARSKEFAQYHVYDIASHTGPFSERYVDLENMINDVLRGDDYIRFVPTEEVFSLEEIQEAFDRFVDLSYEGLMVRFDALYVNKRTNFLLKWKEFIEEEFALLRVESGTGNWNGYAKTAFFITTDGEAFKTGCRGTRAFLKQVLENQEYYQGKPTTVRYTRLTPRGVPRHGQVKEFDRQDA